MRRTHKKRAYSEDFKADALKLVQLGERSVKQIAEELGIPAATLFMWARGQEAADQSDKAEIARLKRELQRVTEERDFLKKAAAFFAKNST